MTTKYGQPSFNMTETMSNVRRRIECEFPDVRVEHPKILKLALNEAEALAEEAGFPQLIFPSLAREKAEVASAWSRRQKAIRLKTRSISFAA